MLGIRTIRRKVDEKLVQPATTGMLLSIVAILVALVALLMSMRGK